MIRPLKVCYDIFIDNKIYYDFFFVSRVLLDKGKSKFNAKDKDGFTPLLRCCQESPMTKDTPPDDDQTEDQKKKEEDKIKQDKSRAEIIKALVAKGANMKIAGKLHL